MGNNIRSWIAVTALLPLVLAALVVSMAVPLAMPPSTSGAASIAITGSFYRQDFVIPAGSGVSGPSIYVIVQNKPESTQQLVIKMSYEAPDGVSIGLSRGEFALGPGEQQEVQVSVNVAATALSGVYSDSLKVIAEAYEEGGGMVSASAAEVASLTILNQSANVTVNTVGPSGQPVAAQVRLFRMAADKGYEVAYSNTGTLQAKVVPGTFTAEAYSLSTADQLCDPETFDVAADESKTVTLTVRMVYFENDFVVSPVRDDKSKKLVSARTMATLTNVYQNMAVAEVRLQVTFNGDPLEELVVLGPLTLALGQTGVPWNYVPVGGWREGLYGFKYQLYVDGALMAETTEQTLKVGGGGVASWLWIIFVILGILAAAGLGFLIFFLLKRQRKEEEKPRKAEKKRKEEKPARKAEEPVRKPEPYRPPEPVRPVEPPRPVQPPPEEEPVVEPAPLASISSLKARMASMGRDQGAGKPTVEEPDAEKQDNPVETSSQTEESDVVPPPPRAEPEPPAVTKTQKPPASQKSAGQKPGIFSSVTATPKQEPPKPPSDVQINWPPKPVEPPKPPSDVQINWPPKPVEPPKPSGLAEVARQRMGAQQPASPTEDAAVEETKEPEAPPSRSSFAEAARLRLEARQRATEAGKGGAKTGASPTEGDDAGGSGEGEDSPPST